jgi:hypothetical protein
MTGIVNTRYALLYWAQTWYICRGCQGRDVGWTNKKHEEHWQFIHGQKQAEYFLKIPSALKKSKGWGITRFEQKSATNNNSLLTGLCHLKRHLH